MVSGVGDLADGDPPRVRLELVTDPDNVGSRRVALHPRQRAGPARLDHVARIDDVYPVFVQQINRTARPSSGSDSGR